MEAAMENVENNTVNGKKKFRIMFGWCYGEC